MSNGIRLDLYNESNDQNNSQVLVFQRNVAPGFSEIAVAWTVIRNLGTGDHHPFTYEYDLAVDANDSFGNYTPRCSAAPGDAYHMILDKSGDVLKPYVPGAANPTDIDVRNDLQTGAIGANIYRSGRLLATKTSVAPGQKADFVFKPMIFVGVASQVQEGQILDSAILSSANTQLSLIGIKSADIVMQGGGPGPSSTPFTFSFRNVVEA